MRRLAWGAPFALAACALVGCHRPQADQPTPGADAQARTAAKTIADLQAADAAAQGPPPHIAPARPPQEETAAKPTDQDDAPADTDREETVEGNAQD